MKSQKPGYLRISRVVSFSGFFLLPALLGTFPSTAAEPPAPAPSESKPLTKKDPVPLKDPNQIEDEEEEELQGDASDDPFAEMEIKIKKRSEMPPLPCVPCGSDGRCTAESSRKPYILFESEEAPEPVVSLGWVACKDCTRGQATAMRFKNEKKRLLARREYYKNHEKQTSLSFIDFETRYLSGHFQTSPDEARRCGLLVEKVTELLLRQAQGDGYLVTSPATHRIIVCENRERYHAYLEWLAKHADNPNKEWLTLARKTASFGTRDLTVIRRDLVVPPRGAGLGHMVIFSFAQMLMKEASKNRAPDWFAEGFSSLCESLVFKTPRCYSIRYEENDLRFDADWSKAVAKGMRNGRARKWQTLFFLDRIGMSVLDYQLCWSAVRFLYKKDGMAFANLPILFRKGKNNKEALEKAYGKPLDRLEKSYRLWAPRDRR